MNTHMIAPRARIIALSMMLGIMIANVQVANSAYPRQDDSQMDIPNERSTHLQSEARLRGPIEAMLIERDNHKVEHDKSALLMPEKLKQKATIPHGENLNAVELQPPLDQEIQIGEARHHKKWNKVLSRAKTQLIALDDCVANKNACLNKNYQSWANIIETAQNLPPNSQLGYVNAAINARARYRTDIHNYGTRDYWASPVETMSGWADCEDYAIAKYFTLRALGFDPAMLRLVVLKKYSNGVEHAVLRVGHNRDAQYLDNLSDKLRAPADMKAYRAIYSVNERAKWAHIPAQTQNKISVIGIQMKQHGKFGRSRPTRISRAPS